jgi:hypothetical protein
MSGERVLVLVLALALAATPAGCGYGEDGGGPAATGAEATTGPDAGDCKGGTTAPFTVEELLEGLRAAGYDMYVDPGCSDRSASWALSNTSIAVSELGPEDFARAQMREGAIGCKLFDAVDGEGAKVAVVHFEGEDWTNLRTLNVSCDITPDPANAQEQIDKLEHTLNELAAARN